QFFVRLDDAGMRYGLRLSALTGEAGDRFRRNITDHGRWIHHLLSESGALADCVLGNDQDSATTSLMGADDLKRWAGGKSLIVSKAVPAGAPLATASELAGDIVLTFDRLLPLFVCAVESDPQAWLVGRLGRSLEDDFFSPDDFYRATFLGESWL